MKAAPFLLIILFLLNACTTTEPEDKFTFTAEDVSCTEVWLNIEANGSVIIEREGAEPKQIEVSGSFTFYEDGLKPNTEYNYTATSRDKKLTAGITTLDTTGNDFTWQTFIFGGEKGGGKLSDVAIINENDIWAVGEIYMPDTNENSHTVYNAVHWDGISWELKQIWFYVICGQDDKTNYPISSIYIFDKNEIWVSSSGRQIVRINEGMQTETICLPFSMSINKIWGSSPNDVYVVGNNGSIAHFDGSSWTKIESGTGLPILGLYGAKDSKYGNYEILCVANSYGSPEGSKVISIKGGSASELWNDGLPYGLDAVWFVPNRKYIAVGDGLWETRIPVDNWVRQSILPALHKTSIDGQNLNDIVVCGAFWLLAHYNGVNWKTYFPLTSGSFTNVKIKANIIVAVGGVDSKAVVAIGKR